MEEETITPDTTEESYDSYESTFEPTDWDVVSQKIADKVAEAIQDKQSSFETVTALHGDQWGEFRVIHEATLGDLLIAFSLLSLTSVILLRWLFKAIWGR